MPFVHVLSTSRRSTRPQTPCRCAPFVRVYNNTAGAAAKRFTRIARAWHWAGQDAGRCSTHGRTLHDLFQLLAVLRGDLVHAFRVVSPRQIFGAIISPSCRAMSARAAPESDQPSGIESFPELPATIVSGQPFGRSLRNSDAGETPVIKSRSRARVQAT
jgi:hypothetical protein